MLDLKVATPQTVLNYGALLCEAKFFEEAFRAYERGVQLFRYPHVKDIWTTYLTQVRRVYPGQRGGGVCTARAARCVRVRLCVGGGGGGGAAVGCAGCLLCSAVPPLSALNRAQPPAIRSCPPVTHPTPPLHTPQFVSRYGGKKVERARDLFRQAIDEAPAEEAKPLFLAFAKYEEEHGLARNAMQVGGWASVCVGGGGGMGDGGGRFSCWSLLRGLRRATALRTQHATHLTLSPCRPPAPPPGPTTHPPRQIYDQAVRKVPESERLALYDVYVARASEFFGIGKVRWVHEGRGAEAGRSCTPVRAALQNPPHYQRHVPLIHHPLTCSVTPPSCLHPPHPPAPHPPPPTLRCAKSTRRRSRRSRRPR